MAMVQLNPTHDGTTVRILDTARQLEGQVQYLRDETEQLRFEQQRRDDLHLAGKPRRETAAEEAVRRQALEAVANEKSARRADHRAFSARRASELSEREGSGRVARAELAAQRAEERLAAARRSLEVWQRNAESTLSECKMRHQEILNTANKRLAVVRKDAGDRAVDLNAHLMAVRNQVNTEVANERAMLEREHAGLERRAEAARAQFLLKVQAAEHAATAAETKRDRQIEAAEYRARRSRQAAASKASLAAFSHSDTRLKLSLRLEQAHEESRLRLDVARQKEAAAVEDLEQRRIVAENRISASERMRENVRQDCQQTMEEQSARLERYTSELKERAVFRDVAVRDADGLSRKKAHEVRSLAERLMEAYRAEVLAAESHVHSEAYVLHARFEDHGALLSNMLCKRQKQTRDTQTHVGVRMGEIQQLADEHLLCTEARNKQLESQANADFVATKQVADERVRDVSSHLNIYLDTSSTCWPDLSIAGTTHLDVCMPLPGTPDH